MERNRSREAGHASLTVLNELHGVPLGSFGPANFSKSRSIEQLRVICAPNINKVTIPKYVWSSIPTNAKCVPNAWTQIKAIGLWRNGKKNRSDEVLLCTYLIKPLLWGSALHVCFYWPSLTLKFMTVAAHLLTLLHFIDLEIKLTT